MITCSFLGKCPEVLQLEHLLGQTLVFIFPIAVYYYEISTFHSVHTLVNSCILFVFLCYVSGVILLFYFK